ncbi:unnamed protein product, partial [Bubo scandiacus]
VLPHQCCVQGDNHFPSPDGHTISDTSQDAVYLLGHLGTGSFLAHVQLGVHQDTQGFFYQAAFHLSGPQHIVVCGVVPPQVQDYALLFLELHEVLVIPFMQPVEVPLDDSMTLWHI